MKKQLALIYFTFIYCYFLVANFLLFILIPNTHYFLNPIIYYCRLKTNPQNGKFGKLRRAQRRRSKQMRALFPCVTTDWTHVEIG